MKILIVKESLKAKKKIFQFTQLLKLLNNLENKKQFHVNYLRSTKQ